MRIAFIDFINWDYNVESASHMPLGGAQSTVCYLTQALAQQGHEVFLLNNTSKAGMLWGVMHFPLNTVPHQLLRTLDVLIVRNLAGEGLQIKQLLGDHTCLIFWTGHDIDQPALQALHNPAEREVYDGIALVSHWLRDRFHQHFGINLTRTAVLGNAIATPFQNLFSPETPILPQKSQPPILAYTSTPFRGLDLLLEVFPKIRSAVPGTRLKVFSSMKVYQVSQTDDESHYGSLYRQCREMEGVEYIGSLPQPELARELQSVMVLAYPNTFAETSCISVMEAMASGCAIVTSELGALPETTAGFARLISIEGGWEAYKNRFVAEIVQVLTNTAKNSTAVETHLKQQVEYVQRQCNWSVRAQQWIQWLSSLREKRGVLADSVPLNSIPSKCTDLQLLAHQCLLQNEYTQAANFYEQVIKTCPKLISNYWYLGLTLLLAGKEQEAKTTWIFAMVNNNSELMDLRIAELVQILKTEAKRREALADYQAVELIKHHLGEITTNV